MPGPGVYLIGEEEKKEVIEVLEAGYLSRFGREDDPKFFAKFAILTTLGLYLFFLLITALAAEQTDLPGIFFFAQSVNLPSLDFLISISAFFAMLQIY